MKIPLAILALVAIILFGFVVFGPAPGPDALQRRTDLPWQITVSPDGGSQVFGLALGSATLADAMVKFGGLEGLAVFEPTTGPMSLEAYFGNVQHGPLKAKVIVALDAGNDELVAIRERSRRREGSPSGDWKYRLSDAPKDHATRRIKALTYLPGTRALDKEFFRSRFGEPAATLQESEQAVSWFYPSLGLSVLIDDNAGEVLEYQAPRDFVMPGGATPHSAVQ
ncbi:MAG: hypothetical protein WBN68_00875 [Sedimenticolaceae bacterium]